MVLFFKELILLKREPKAGLFLAIDIGENGLYETGVNGPLRTYLFELLLKAAKFAMK